MESLTPYQVDYEVTFVFLVVYAMCLCPVIYEVNSTRKLSDVYSLDMIMSENANWKCCDPNTNPCYTSRDVVFDEASSWWSSQAVVLPNSGNLETSLQEKLDCGLRYFFSSANLL